MERREERDGKVNIDNKKNKEDLLRDNGWPSATNCTYIIIFH